MAPTYTPLPDRARKLLADGADVDRLAAIASA